MEFEPSHNLSLLESEEEEQDYLNQIANKLTQHALDKKSNDNISVVLVMFPAAKTIRQRDSDVSHSSSFEDNSASLSQVGHPSTRGNITDKKLFTAPSDTQ